MSFLFGKKRKASKPDTIHEEYFKTYGEEMTLVDQVTVKGSRVCDYTAFGAKIIPSDSDKTYIWTVRINGIGSNGGLICIGIVDNKYNEVDDQYCTADYELYAMETGVNYLNIFPRHASNRKDRPPFKQGDILQIKLDMKQQTFTIKINDQNPGYIQECIKIR